MSCDNIFFFSAIWWKNGALPSVRRNSLRSILFWRRAFTHMVLHQKNTWHNDSLLHTPRNNFVSDLKLWWFAHFLKWNVPGCGCFVALRNCLWNILDVDINLKFHRKYHYCYDVSIIQNRFLLLIETIFRSMTASSWISRFFCPGHLVDEE